MTDSTRLPGLEDCIDLYLRAFDRHGTGTFAPEELDAPRSSQERDRLLDLAVAYGLLSTDGSTYTVSRAPGAPDGDWQAVLVDRADRIRQALHNQQADETDSPSAGPAEGGISYDGRSFSSTFVTDSTDFEETAAAVASVARDTHDGVVLRSAGDRANRVQRFADRLCDPTGTDDLPFSTALQKEHTDVIGNDTDELEFRLFLVPA